MKIIYSAVFVNKDDLIKKYPPTHPNVYYHHSTIEFKPKSIDDLPIGNEIKMDVIGRLTTDNVDVLLVKNPLSKNLYPHITLSTADGIKPFQSNDEILKNLDDVLPLDDYIIGICGVFDGKDDIIDPKIKLKDAKDKFNNML